MQGQEPMELAKEGAKALNKFQEILLKVFGPLWTKRQADADAYADQRKLQTIRDNPDMDIVYVNGEMSARQRASDGLYSRTEQRLLTEAIRQERNLENVIEIASSELDDQKTVEEEVDNDWIARFFNTVKDISTEEMQMIWGKILAEEIVRPKSFSLRTLDTLHNLSKEEASVFERVCPLVFELNDSVCIPADMPLLEKHGVEYEDIICLHECGLINMVSIVLSLPFPPNVSIYAYLSNNKYTIKINGKVVRNNQIQIPVYKLTRAGAELRGIVTSQYSEAYMIDLAEKVFRESGQCLNIGVFELLDRTNGMLYPKFPAIKEFGANPRE